MVRTENILIKSVCLGGSSSISLIEAIELGWWMWVRPAFPLRTLISSRKFVGHSSTEVPHWRSVQMAQVISCKHWKILDKLTAWPIRFLSPPIFASILATYAVSVGQISVCASVIQGLHLTTAITAFATVARHLVSDIILCRCCMSSAETWHLICFVITNVIDKRLHIFLSRRYNAAFCRGEMRVLEWRIANYPARYKCAQVDKDQLIFLGLAQLSTAFCQSNFWTTPSHPYWKLSVCILFSIFCTNMNTMLTSNCSFFRTSPSIRLVA